MAIDPTKENQTEDNAGRDAYRAAIREGAGVAIRSACAWLPIGSAVLLAGLYAAANSFVSAEEILADGGDYWQEAFMPVVLFAIFGGCFGSFLGWRMTTTSGMIGQPTMLIGAGAALILVLIGLIGAIFIFEEGIPILVWISLGATCLFALGGMSFFAIWVR